MSLSLECDGLPNCGEDTIPNPDEACFKVLSISQLLLDQRMLFCSNSDPLVFCSPQSRLVHPVGRHPSSVRVLFRQNTHQTHQEGQVVVTQHSSSCYGTRSTHARAERNNQQDRDDARYTLS